MAQEQSCSLDARALARWPRTGDDPYLKVSHLRDHESATLAARHIATRAPPGGHGTSVNVSDEPTSEILRWTILEPLPRSWRSPTVRSALRATTP